MELPVEEKYVLDTHFIHKLNSQKSLIFYFPKNCIFLLKNLFYF